MVGLAGAVGYSPDGLDRPAERLAWTGREVTTTTTVAETTVSVVRHPTFAADQPARADDGTHLWVWGSPRGVHGPDGYEPRDAVPHATPARYCASQYDRFGADFVDRLNGSFAGALREPDGTVRLFTDRLGSRPLYHWRDDGGVVFATGVQALAAHPAVAPELDAAALAEYVATRRVAGTRTPLEGVRALPPATVATLRDDGRPVPGDGRLDARRYWRPIARPTDASFDALVSAFRKTLARVLDEATDADRDYGLLLSGGSDSRLLLAALAERCSPVAYHAAGWMSREARTAERAARTAGVPFTLLHRDDDYQRDALDRNPGMMNFYGTFDQAHLSGFSDRLADEVDVVVSGLYADVLFKGHSLRTASVSMGPLGTAHLPVERSVDSLDAFVDARLDGTPASLDDGIDVRAAVADGLRRRDGEIEYRGVTYPSLRELVAADDLYPLSNDPDLFYYGLEQAHPHFAPYLDDRLVDLALRIPVRHQLRDDVISGATRELSPALAAIPNPRYGVRPADGFPRNVVRRHLVALRRRFGPSSDPPDAGLSHGPWVDDDALIRATPFVLDALVDHRERIEALPALDWEGTLACYRDHLAGADNTDELYALLSVLEMPLIDDLLDAGDPADDTGDPATDGTTRRTQSTNGRSDPSTAVKHDD